MTRVHEVVISGVAGLFPECDDFEELVSKLLNGVDLVTTDDHRWTQGEMGVPAALGKLKNPDQFDLTLFGIPRKLVEITDPNTRLSVMTGFRAVCDAGVNPDDLSGSNTAVFMSSFTSETEDEYLTQNANLGTYGIIANSRAMQANRLSFFLNLKGPSNVVDANWCGGAQAIQCAYELISTGSAYAAIIGSSSLIFKPQVSVHYQAMGRLSQDGVSRCFSSDANGYARSEGVVCMFLQRAEHARRSYGTILGAKTVHSGVRSNGFLDMESSHFKRFLQEIYAESGVKPEDISYYEAGACASPSMDAKELNAVADFYLPGRTKPLMIGSVKSNLGHTEGASNLVSLAKALVALDRGVIPPNLHYKSPNPNVPALVSGQLEVVTKPTKFEGDTVAVTNFGISGSTYSHVIVKKNQKMKTGVLKYGELPGDGIPRLVLLSDRNKSNALANIKRLGESPIDVEMCSLLNSLYRDGIRGQLYKGYTVLNGLKNNYNQVESYSTTQKTYRKPIWFMFSGMGSQWPSMGKALMRLPSFARTIEECGRILLTKGLNLVDILTRDDPKIFDSIVNCFVGIAAVQLGLLNILKEIGVEPDGMIGHSVGELGCGYTDGCLTLEQMILSAYARGKASSEASLVKGTMAAVGLGYDEIKSELPEAIDVACRNSKTSCTLSGPVEEMECFVKRLKSDGVFAKIVNVANIAYHSRYIQPAGPLLQDYLKTIIPSRKLRSSKWLSSSIPENAWDSELAKYSSADYYTNNLLSPVLFEEVTRHVPSGAILIEIAPHGLLQPVVKRSLPSVTHVSLTSRFDDDNLMFFLGALGKLYISGVPVSMQRLYPVEYPISRGTPSISHFVGWGNSERFKFEINHCNDRARTWKDLSIRTQEGKYSFLASHKVKNRIILPNSFFVQKISELYMKIKSKNNPTPTIVFDELMFQNEAEVPDAEGSCDLSLQLMPGTGSFCFTRANDGVAVAAGKVSISDQINLPLITKSSAYMDLYVGQDVMAFMESHGLALENTFALIVEVTMDQNHLEATVSWNGGFVEYLNAVLTLVAFYHTRMSNSLHLVDEIENLTVDFGFFSDSTMRNTHIVYDHTTQLLQSSGITLLLPKTKPVHRYYHTYGFFEVHRFIPYNFGEIGSGNSAVHICHQLISENSASLDNSWTKIKVLSLGSNLFHESLSALAQQYPQVEISTISAQHFTEHDLASIRGKIAWIVSSKHIPFQTMRKITSLASKTFILEPFTTREHSENTFNLFTFTSSFEKYSLQTFTSGKTITIEKVYLDDITTLKSKLCQANEKNLANPLECNVVCLIGKVESQWTILNMLDKMSSLTCQHLLRYFFVDDLNALTKYDAVMVGNRKMNVIKEGKFGSLRSLPSKSEIAFDLKESFSIADALQSSEVTALCINLKDLSGSGGDDVGIWEYADSTMGLGTYDVGLKFFKKDSILKWPVPRKWQVADAATVPLLYSLAVYILGYNNAGLDSDSILVTRGSLPISQALLSLLIPTKTETFVTVANEEEKKQLLEVFPALSDSSILIVNSSSFYIELLQKTSGNGVCKVVNTYNEEEMVKPCTECVGRLGVYIHLSLTPLKNKNKMGMIAFMKEIVAIGIHSESLMTLAECDKNQIKLDLQSAIDKGIVQPFNKITMPAETYLADVVQYLKLARTKIVTINSKVAHKNCNMIDFSENKTFLIVDNSGTQTWLNLAGWLLGKGARLLAVVLKDTNLCELAALRLRCLREKYILSRLSLVQRQNLPTEIAIRMLLSGIDQSHSLSGVFMINSNRQLVDMTAKMIDARKSSSALICLGLEAEDICEERSKRGLLSLCIRMAPSEKNSRLVFERLDHLIGQSTHYPVVTFKSQSNKTIDSSLRGTHVPCNAVELKEFRNMGASADHILVEINTNGLQMRYPKEAKPIYIFPGLQPRLIRRIAQQIFHPAWEVRYPSDKHNIVEIAQDISRKMLSTSQNMFTIVAEDWGSIAALHVACNLEAQGKIVRLILVDGIPTNVVNWASQLTKDYISLIDRYVNIPYKVKMGLRTSASWDEIVDTVMRESNLNESDIEQTVKSLDILRRRLENVIDVTMPTHKFQRPCYLFNSYPYSQQVDNSGLQQYLSSEAVIQVVPPESEEKITDFIADKINALVLFETEDAANPPRDEYLRTTYVKSKKEFISSNR